MFNVKRKLIKYIFFYKRLTAIPLYGFAARGISAALRTAYCLLPTLFPWLLSVAEASFFVYLPLRPFLPILELDMNSIEGVTYLV